MTNQPASKQKHKHKHKNKYKHKHKIHTKAKWLEREKKKKHTHNHKHKTEWDVQLARQADKRRFGRKREQETDRKLWKKNTKKIFSYIFMFNTHLLLFVYITRYVCVFAISHMLIYSLRSTPQIHARAVSVLRTHTLPLAFIHSFVRFNPNSLFSHLSELCVCTAKATEKRNM